MVISFPVITKAAYTDIWESSCGSHILNFVMLDVLSWVDTWLSQEKIEGNFWIEQCRGFAGFQRWSKKKTWPGGNRRTHKLHQTPIWWDCMWGVPDGLRLSRTPMPETPAQPGNSRAIREEDKRGAFHGEVMSLDREPRIRSLWRAAWGLHSPSLPDPWLAEIRHTFSGYTK